MTQTKKALDLTGEVKQRVELRKIPEKIFLFIMELAVPALIAAVAIYYLSGIVNIPFAYQRLIPWIYAAALVLISLLIAVVGTEIPRIIQKKDAKPNRLIKTGVSGLGIPLLALLLANFTNLPNGQSYLAYYLPSTLMRGVTLSVPSISAAILQSSDIRTKVAGINALGAIRDPNNLNQLTQILSQTGSDLKNAIYYQALSKAIASYGIEARPALIGQFSRWSQAISPAPFVSTSTLYDQYFADSIQALRSAISNQDLDSAEKTAQLQQLNDIENNLQSDLDHLQVNAVKDTASDIRLDFILDTFFRMTIQQDAELLNLSKAVAANPVYPAVDRKKAILLIGKFGGKDELVLVASYLQNSSDVIKTGAIEALVLLDQKTNAIPRSATPVPSSQ
jgi:hypothetical protein